MASAASAAELKQAIVEACLSNLGADVTPAGWLEGQTASMAVQFLDPQGSVHTLKPTTDFRAAALVAHAPRHRARAQEHRGRRSHGGLTRQSCVCERVSW